MKEVDALAGTAAFHRLVNLPVLDTPTIPSADRCRLRINLLQEELNELKEAIEENDLTEIADALTDLQYVLSGAIHEFGLGDKFSALFDEVQRSNMSKACATREEAEQTLHHYHEKDGTSGHIVEKDDVFLVYRNHDGKVLKSINYSPADLSSVLTSD